MLSVFFSYRLLECYLRLLNFDILLFKDWWYNLGCASQVLVLFRKFLGKGVEEFYEF